MLMRWRLVLHTAEDTRAENFHVFAVLKDGY